MAITFNQAVYGLDIGDIHLLDAEKKEQDPMTYFQKAADAFRSKDSANGLRYWEQAMSSCSTSQQSEFTLTFKNLRIFHGIRDNGKDITYNFVRASDQERLHTLEIFLFSRIVNSAAQATLLAEGNFHHLSENLKERVHVPGAGGIEQASPFKRLEFIVSCTRQLMFDFALDVVPGGTIAKFVLRRSLDTFCDIYTAPSVQLFVSNTLNTLRPKAPIILRP